MMAGRFDEDTYARARKWREQQEAKSAEKPAAKTPSKSAPKAESKPAEPAKGSGRGGVGGPTADELAAYDKKQKDKRFEESVRANLKTSERDEMNKYRDRAIGAGVTAASLAAPALSGAMRAKKAAEPLAALRDMTKGGPRAASRVTPRRPTPDAIRRSEEGFSPAEANRALARARSTTETPKAAPKPKRRSPRKPDVSMAPARAPKSESARKRTRYNNDETNMAKGGSVKRGYGAAKKG